ncbi:MAG: hypothetical protein IIX83_04000, partial [Peptococcaceae bacterium]|nr:hypothetical protein [Peptococcaceae bacterium]
YNYSISTCKLQAELADGHIHGDLRRILAMVDYGVYYNEKNRELTIFPELLFDEAGFADGAITLDEIAAMGSLDNLYDAYDDDTDYDEEVPMMEQYFDFA